MIKRDWYIDEKGDLKLNYGGYTEPKWEDWQEKFCWLPTKIIVKAEAPYDISYYKYVWLKRIYFRRRLVSFYPQYNYQYEYAEDLFDLIKRESK